jgi:hypothetical protein
MIYDLKQPAKHWLADHLKNFGKMLDRGDDPSFLVEFDGVEIEIRLNKLPGSFERKTTQIRRKYSGYEEMRSDFECQRNNALDEYFNARPQLMRTRTEESLFESGFRVALDLLKQDQDDA